MNSYEAIAKCLHDSGITTMFGVVGIPIAPLALEAQKCGIRFIATRNEQVLFFFLNYI